MFVYSQLLPDSIISITPFLCLGQNSHPGNVRHQTLFFFFKGWEKFLNVVSIQVEFCKLICPPVPTGVGSFLVCLERKCQAPVVAPTFCHGSKINIKWQNRGRGFHNNCFALAGWACVVSVRGVGLMPVGHYHFGEQCCQDEQKSSLDVCLPGQLWLMFLKR